MQISVTAKTQKLIEEHIKKGGYESADDVLLAALASLSQQQCFGDFEPGEMEQLLAEGERSGRPLDGRQVFKELRALRKRNKKAG